MSPPLFLCSLLERYESQSSSEPRPHVTLTFAQSLDAKIAGKGGKQLILSGKDSMVMTHWMRTMHDAILVGIGTALNDDPQLNTRHLPPKAPDPSKNGHNNPYHLPRPIVLDTHLRLLPTCKLLGNYQKGVGRRPWVLCAEPSGDDAIAEWIARRTVLEKAGARIIPIPHGASEGHLNLRNVLKALRDLEIQSIMVEGGASVIKSFLSEVSANSDNIIDTIIVTVAPTFVGDQGVSYGAGLQEIPGFKHAGTELFGIDSVVVLVPTAT